MSNTQINPYRNAAPIDWQPIAAGLLLDFERYFSLNGDRTDEKGGADMSVYSAEPDYQAGSNGQEARPLSSLAAALGSSLSGNFCFGFWINPIDTSGTNRTIVRLSDGFPGGGSRLGVSIWDAGTQARLFVDDNDDADEPVVSATITPGVRRLCIVNLNWAAKTAEFFVAGISQGTTVAVSNWWTDMIYLSVRANVGSDDADAVDYVSRLFCMRRLATADEITYLALDKSYADITADAVP